LDGKMTPSTEVIQEFWTEIVQTLKVQFDDIQGQSYRAEEPTIAIFFRNGSLILFFFFLAIVMQKPAWCYTPPKRLFPPPACKFRVSISSRFEQTVKRAIDAGIGIS
jgi:hypothetical protein